MGYTTDFFGKFDLDKPLLDAHKNYLIKFNETRRMKRDAKIAELMEDPARIAAKLPIGKDGEYFVGSKGFFGQEKDSSIKDYNNPPSKQPGLWCQWVPSEDGTALEWDQGEKFYEYVEWLNYIIKNFLVPWNYTLNGNVKFQGEDYGDNGTIIVENNDVKVIRGRVISKY